MVDIQIKRTTIAKAWFRNTESHLSAMLNMICVGTGRDGTQSITHMVQNLFDHAGRSQRVMHEYQSREFYQAFCDFCETGDARYLDEIRRMIEVCPFDCIVGNGYAAVLPWFAERCGRDATLVHIRRRDRAACIGSLKANCDYFPAAYGYYTTSSEANMKRMAAFHFGESSRDEWSRLSLDEKFAWYYDKTHALIASSKHLFAGYVEIPTERIDDEPTRRTIARLAIGDDAILPPITHLNSHEFVRIVPSDRRARMQWLFGRLNLSQVAHDDVYAVEYFLEKYVAWTGYQMSGVIREISPHDVRTTLEIKASLDRAARVVGSRLKDIETLRAMIQSLSIRSPPLPP
jgi:hypothetical protein